MRVDPVDLKGHVCLWVSFCSGAAEMSFIDEYISEFLFILFDKHQG